MRACVWWQICHLGTVHTGTKNVTYADEIKSSRNFYALNTEHAATAITHDLFTCLWLWTLNHSAQSSVMTAGGQSSPTQRARHVNRSEVHVSTVIWSLTRTWRWRSPACSRCPPGNSDGRRSQEPPSLWPSPMQRRCRWMHQRPTSR